MNRRNFLRKSSALALSTLAMPSISNAMQALPAHGGMGKIARVGVQLYSVKDVLEQDLKGVLQKLAKIGYTEIESYPGQLGGHYYNMEPKAFASLLDDLGMKLVSSHFSSGSEKAATENWRRATMLSRFDELVEKAALTGQQYLTCSWMDTSLRNTVDDLKRTAELFNHVGEKCKKAGLQFAYHNHAFEFEKVGDSLIYDFMLDHTDPDLVQFEMDIFWLVAGKFEPAVYFTKYPGRFPLGHVKDRSKSDPKKNTEIGTGAIDYAAILKAARNVGMKHFIVEQESFTMPSLNSMAINYQNLSAMNI